MVFKMTMYEFLTKNTNIIEILSVAVGLIGITLTKFFKEYFIKSEDRERNAIKDDIVLGDFIEVSLEEKEKNEDKKESNKRRKGGTSAANMQSQIGKRQTRPANAQGNKSSIFS